MDAVWGEPLSSCIPCKQGNKQGNREDFGRYTRAIPPINHRNCAIYGPHQAPESRNKTGNSSTLIREFDFLVTGLNTERSRDSLHTLASSQYLEMLRVAFSK